MSDQQPRSGVHDPELESLEREKLRGEVRKLRVDNSLANRLFTTILSASAVLIAGSQIWMAYQQKQSDIDRAAHDASLKEIELHIRQVESGVQLSLFAINQRNLFLSANADEQVRAVRLVQALLPPQEAQRMLDAMGNAATQAEVLNVVATSKQLIARAAGQAVASVAPPSTAPPVPVGQPTVTSQPNAIPGLPLEIYYHVRRADDRNLADAVAGAAAGRQFLSAGVQLVSQGPSSAQVRYYQSGQKPAAELLAQLLSEQIEAVTGTKITFSAVDISATFPNLPSGRMEVWFAPAMPAMKPS